MICFFFPKARPAPPSLDEGAGLFFFPINGRVYEVMIDFQYIKNNPEKVKELCRLRNCKVDIDDLLKLDAERLTLLNKIEALRAERNTLTESERERGKEIKLELKELEPKLSDLT